MPIICVCFFASFHNEAVSIRLGTKLPKKVVMTQDADRIPSNQWKCICIEGKFWSSSPVKQSTDLYLWVQFIIASSCFVEPFDLSNTARSVFDENTFKKIIRVFRLSFSKIRASGDVNSLFEGPLWLILVVVTLSLFQQCIHNCFLLEYIICGALNFYIFWVREETV